MTGSLRKNDIVSILRDKLRLIKVWYMSYNFIFEQKQTTVLTSQRICPHRVSLKPPLF